MKLNDFEEQTLVYKYQKASVANLCLTLKNGQKGTLQFSRPSKWKDPTERVFYEAKISPKGIIDATRVYACCISMNKLSEAAWITYQYGTNEGCVKFSIYFDRFIQQIEDWANENGYSFYYGKVIYDEWKVLKKIGDRDFKYNKEIFVPNARPMETFLRTLLLKRKAFEYENEIRLFLVNNNEANAQDSFIVDIDWRDCLNDQIYYSGDCRIDAITELRKKAKQVSKKVEKNTIYDEKLPVKYKLTGV